MNDLVMFGRAFGRTTVNENGIPIFSHMSTEEFISEFNKATKK